MYSYCPWCLVASETAILTTILSHLGKIQQQHRPKVLQYFSVYIHMDSCISCLLVLHFGLPFKASSCLLLLSCAPFSHWALFSWRLWRSDTPPFVFFYFLLLSGYADAGSSSGYFPAPVLESVISLSSPGSFYGQMALESEI